jgi:hypothetical protein
MHVASSSVNKKVSHGSSDGVFSASLFLRDGFER